MVACRVCDTKTRVHLSLRTIWIKWTKWVTEIRQQMCFSKSAEIKKEAAVIQMYPRLYRVQSCSHTDPQTGLLSSDSFPVTTLLLISLLRAPYVETIGVYFVCDGNTL